MYQGDFVDVGTASVALVSQVDANGNPISGFDSSRPANATLTQVASSTVSVTVLAANPARRKAIFYNATNKGVNIAYGAIASATAFTIPIAALGSYESEINDYTGVVSAIWPTAPGAGPKLIVTEITT